MNNSLDVWKHDLQEVKAGRPLKPPYDTVREYTSWPPEVRLVFDALLSVVEALTGEKK